MTDPEQGGELEMIIQGIDFALEVKGKNTLMFHMERDWPTIRAALEQQAELVAALEGLAVENPRFFDGITLCFWCKRDLDISLHADNCAWTQAKALLARSAEEVGERG